MRAMVVVARGSSNGQPARLAATELAPPTAGPDEILVRVSVCGVCRTDLDLLEGRLAATRYPVAPGHQIVGRVAAAGTGDADFRVGDRVGVAWIHSACGACRWCVAGDENLCPRFRATGCDVHGGYAEYVTVPAAFAHRIPEAISDSEAAPLLCAGAIGLRALRLAKLTAGDPLGLTGFGASAHLVLQLARLRAPTSPVYVFARSAPERDFALQLGAAWAGGTGDPPPAPMAAVIDTTPAWRPIVAALPHLLPGGRIVINAIRKSDADQDELLNIRYESHLWMERELKTVANVTRADVREVLEIAARSGLRPAVEELALAQANEALDRLRSASGSRGAMVLRL